MLNTREVVEAFLDKKSNDTVGVEDKISTCSVLVPYHSSDPTETSLSTRSEKVISSILLDRGIA